MCAPTVIELSDGPSQTCSPKDPEQRPLDDSVGTLDISDSDVDVYEDDAQRPAADGQDDARFLDIVKRDSIEVQKDRKVNDDELHEENPRLQDYLVPHHRHVESSEDSEASERQEQAKPVPQAEATSEPRAEATLEPQEQVAKSKRKVHFGTVLVRDYDMTMGDHPCCSYGPPVMLDWNYLEYNAIDVNEYEFHHPPRRNLREMGMKYYQRKALLENSGYTEEDFKAIKKVVNRTKLNRQVTRSVVSHPLPLHKVEDAVESATRKFKRLIKTGSRRSLTA